MDDHELPVDTDVSEPISPPGPDTADDTYRSQCPEDATVGVGVVEAVASATGRDPLDLPSLEHHVDSEALDALVESAAAGSDLRVSFDYAGVDVVVRAGGEIVASFRRVGPA
ncbi:HalOD1 output domain-containing protein [Halorarum halobium]|uniref:HalOD1 output domain-containing protein n=1 Tax=Halorarum halobium TaxID=3075121 RepID=UPI0028B02893|nr:HalOD1 output domain-containing protein [Halobaculum sp. XH14]